MGFAGLGDEVTHSCGEQGPEHLGEGEEQEGSATKCVNGPDGGPGEDEIDEAEAEGSE